MLQPAKRATDARQIGTRGSRTAEGINGQNDRLKLFEPAQLCICEHAQVGTPPSD